jgi:hypothetical protein
VVIQFCNEITAHIFEQFYRNVTYTDIEFFVSKELHSKSDIVEIDLSSKIEPLRHEYEVIDYINRLDKSKKYFGLWYYGEGLTPKNKFWKILLDNNIPIYSSTYEPELILHRNFHYDLAWSFHYFNIVIGCCYIDRTNLEKINYKKKYKIGLYGLSKWKQNKNTNRNWRTEYINWFKDKKDCYTVSYQSPYEFQLSQKYRNQHFSTAFDFRNCNYFLTSETHFGVMPNTFPYFTTEKILKAVFMELFDINTLLITSPAHYIDLHDYGFNFSNSKFIKEYTSEGIINSLYDTYNSEKIIETNNLKLMDKILSENIFKKHGII